MILTPTDHSIDWKSPPRLALGLSMALILLFVFWHLADLKREQSLDSLYRSQLLPIEWELYETHAGRSGQAAIVAMLKAAHARDDITAIRRQIGSDEAFVADVHAQGRNYMPSEVFSRWQEARKQFDTERHKLAAEAIGITPAQFRPITFLTYTIPQPDAVQLIGVLFLLLTTGIAIELALGSGALLTAWLGGGVVGGMVYLGTNGHGVLPFTGGAAAIASVVGMFLIHFRTSPSRWFNRIDVTSAIILPLWLAFLAAGFFVSGLRGPELLAQAGGLLSAPLWYFSYKRWFALDGDTVTDPKPDVENIDDAYRQQLHLALDAIGRMEFVEARQKLRSLIKTYPNDLRTLVPLFQLEKLSPESHTLDAVARRIFTLDSTDDGARSALLTYREYERISPEKRALDIETCLKLVIRFSRMGEMKDCERLMKQVIDRKTEHPLLPKAALAIAQAYEKLDSPTNAERYREMASRN
jgi:membrane associated rhomboid family serine protease